MRAYTRIPNAGENPLPENGKLVIGDLVVGNIRSYFDESGSYMNHLEASANRTPTNHEMDQLAQYGIVCVGNVGTASHPISQSEDPHGWSRVANNVQSAGAGAVPYKTDFFTKIILLIGVVIAIPVLCMFFSII